jgi:hypothetical protein
MKPLPSHAHFSCLAGDVAQVLVPEGHLKIAHRFNGGFRVEQKSSPEGTAEINRVFYRNINCNEHGAEASRLLSSLRDITPSVAANPRLKPWAIFVQSLRDNPIQAHSETETRFPPHPSPLPLGGGEGENGNFARFAN